MKLKATVFQKIILATAMILLMEVVNSEIAFGQVPPPPPPPNGGSGTGHGLGGNQGTPGAPIGGGFEILLALGALYTGRKVIGLRKNKNESEIK